MKLTIPVIKGPADIITSDDMLYQVDAELVPELPSINVPKEVNKNVSSPCLCIIFLKKVGKKVVYVERAVQIEGCFLL